MNSTAIKACVCVLSAAVLSFICCSCAVEEDVLDLSSMTLVEFDDMPISDTESDTEISDTAPDTTSAPDTTASEPPETTAFEPMTDTEKAESVDTQPTTVQPPVTEPPVTNPPETNPPETDPPVSAVDTEPAVTQAANVHDYILNNNTKKFHLTTCKSAASIKSENKGSFTGTREAIIAKGYSPCGNCKP